MKTTVAVLILISFLQNTITSLDLVLLILLIRAYIRPSNTNLKLGFAFGLLISILNNTQLGFYSIIYLILIEAVYLFIKLPISRNIFTLAFLNFILLLVAVSIESFILKETANFKLVIIASLLSFPIYVILRIWEERFIAPVEIKLKINL